MDKGKIATFLLILLILVSLSLAGVGFYFFQTERTKNVALQKQLEEINSKLVTAETNLRDYKKISYGLETKLKLAETEIDKLNSDIQQEKIAKIEALAKLEQLKMDLEQQKSLRTDLEKKFNKAQKDAEKIQGQLKILNSEKSELESKLKELETQSQGVELGKIVVGPESTLLPQSEVKAVKEKSQKAKSSALEGKVLVVNKDYNFIVINLGSKDGVETGNVFSIYHDTKYVGDVKVEKVHDFMAAAGFLTGDIKDKTSEEDRVVRKGK